ncbi:hypothetical protein BI023_gp37 [Mycobacterium phage Sneeze]|uniref:Uncharacterized protein n=2 Tax=Liefievirus TaxID=1623288 RepID=A0A481VSN8_9CAUD|nr:hypothetical protein BI023_gp37 [Mycobacterium phage Sneeze]YP_010051254.1 hypothetical protein KDW68_gp37 [Mycobacterium phage Paito]YP_010051382.1 hypothetical protein KDW71_gp37 [Mycobacterium phage Rabbs]ANU79775.1 hypothetical protein SEA_SNEEZE_37 [Mycobacterium phage Sneeze]AYD84622.1 hypothetical protein SEA_PAITO_37 [Mycobacterium phage Paito]QBI96790.1 hypothetical protein SEA_RABBS_37 [Mycobacterium phage Rabbs]
MSAGSMDNERVRIVNVDDECVLAVIAFPNGAVDIKSKLPASESARVLRDLATAIEARG